MTGFFNVTQRQITPGMKLVCFQLRQAGLIGIDIGIQPRILVG